MSGIYTSKLARRGLRRRAWRARNPLRYIIVIAVGALLVFIAGIAGAAILLHGRGTLVAPAVQQQNLQVSSVRLSRPLTPGSTADLLISVRNPNTFGARIDQVRLVGALRKAAPPGCTAKVSGLVTKPAGHRLPRADQVLVGAGAKGNVVVRAAFALAASARTGCGFTVEVDVSATQLPSSASPTTASSAPAPASTTPTQTTTTIPPKGSPTSPAAPHTLDPHSVPTSEPPPPPTMAPDDCDPVAPGCSAGLLGGG